MMRSETTICNGAATFGGKLNRTTLKRYVQMLWHLLPACLLVYIDQGFLHDLVVGTQREQDGIPEPDAGKDQLERSGSWTLPASPPEGAGESEAEPDGSREEEAWANEEEEGLEPMPDSWEEEQV